MNEMTKTTPLSSNEECSVCMTIMNKFQARPPPGTYSAKTSGLDPRVMVNAFFCSHGLCMRCSYDIITHRGTCCARCPLCRASPCSDWQVWYLYSVSIDGCEKENADTVSTHRERRTLAAIRALRNCLPSTDGVSSVPRVRRVRP